MSILERVQADTREAMKAGERDRVGALRLVANALQQEAKEGEADEVAALRRERRRRLEDAVLRELGVKMGCDVHLRGNVLTLDGDEGEVRDAAAVVDELVGLIERGHDLAPATIDTVAGAMDATRRPAEILEDVIWRHRSIKVAPKTVNQKRYVDSIRDHTVTFGIGPAGTGKTFLAVAMAVGALEAREVNRIILTRPAVEAGERLGFLPGDIQAKVDPYLRPLFDALYDMLDPERVSTYFDRGIIEVAPLAFMPR